MRSDHDDPAEIARRQMAQRQEAQRIEKAARDTRDWLDSIDDDKERSRELRAAADRKDEAEAQARKKRRASEARQGGGAFMRQKKPGEHIREIFFGHGLLLLLMALVASFKRAAASIGGMLAGTQSAASEPARAGVAGATVAKPVSRNSTRPRRTTGPELHSEGGGRWQNPPVEIDRRTPAELRAELARRDREKALPGLRAKARSQARGLYGSPRFYAALGKRIIGNLDQAADEPGAYMIISDWNQVLAERLFSSQLSPDDDGFQALRAKVAGLVERHGDLEIAMAQDGVTPQVAHELGEFIVRSFPEPAPQQSVEVGGVGEKTAERRARLSSPHDPEPEPEAPSGPRMR